MSPLFGLATAAGAGGTMELFFFCLRTLGGRYSLSCFLRGHRV